MSTYMQLKDKEVSKSVLKKAIITGDSQWHLSLHAKSTFPSLVQR